MSQVEMGRTRPIALIIASVVPALVIVAAILIIAGGSAGFIVPAAVVGAMVSMLTFVSVRDRGRPEVRKV